MTETITRYDRGAVSSKAIVTDEGFLKAHAIVTRTGVFSYLNADGTIRKELRHPKDVLNADSLQSLKMRPITNGHPAQKLVTAQNIKELSVGYTGETVNADGKYLSTTLLVTDPAAIKDITERKKTELSLGYTVELIAENGKFDGEDYTHRQTNIKYNHLAIVDKARAGPEARIHLDGQDAQEVEDSRNDYAEIEIKKEFIMSDQGMTPALSSITLDGVEYKAEREVAKALHKAKADADAQKVALDSAMVEVEKLKAERDMLKQQVEDAKKVNIDEQIQVGVKARIALIEDFNKIMGKKAADVQLDSLSDVEIKIAALKEKAANIKIDGQSQVYIDASFDMLKEFSQVQSTKESDNFGKHREAVTTKADSTAAPRDAKAAREEMKARLYGKSYATNSKDAKDAQNPTYKEAFCNK